MPPQDRASLIPFVDRLMNRSPLSEAEKDAILDIPVRTADVLANRDFLLPDEDVDYACMVAEGIVGRFAQNAAGARQFSALYIAGDMPNLHSVVLPTGSSGFQAMSLVRLLRVPHAALRSLAGRFPAIAEAFWRDTVVDNSIMAEWMVSIGRRDARSRMAHLLCEMAVRYGKGGAAELGYRFPVTQSNLADMLGLTAVHVNRTLKSLRDDMLVNVRGPAVQILDWGRLIKVAEFDPAYLHLGVRADSRLRLALIA